MFITIIFYHLIFIIFLYHYGVEYFVSDSMENYHLGEYFASLNHVFTQEI
jgi:hypothetical protein